MEIIKPGSGLILDLFNVAIISANLLKSAVMVTFSRNQVLKLETNQLLKAIFKLEI